MLCHAIRLIVLARRKMSYSSTVPCGLQLPLYLLLVSLQSEATLMPKWQDAIPTMELGIGTGKV